MVIPGSLLEPCKKVTTYVQVEIWTHQCTDAGANNQIRRGSNPGGREKAAGKSAEKGANERSARVALKKPSPMIIGPGVMVALKSAPGK